MKLEIDESQMLLSAWEATEVFRANGPDELSIEACVLF